MMPDSLPKKLKSLFLVVFILLVPILLWLTIEWSRLHGFWGGILFWLKHGAGDPILLAAEIDFLVFLAVVGLTLLYDFFRIGGKTSAKFALWCVLYLLFPSLGFLTYVLFIRPQQKPH
jgi:hypothetical protein